MSTTTTERAPGIYADIAAEEYHGGPGVSASTLKRLMPPYTPAHARYGEPHTSDALDFGKVAHRLVLGDGEAYVVSPYDSFRTNEARAWKAEQAEAGRVIVTEEQLARAKAMAKAIQDHPLIGQLFTEGAAEQSLYWVDEGTGLLCRARFDWLRNVQEGRRLLIPDYKTARSIYPPTFARAASDYGYDLSAAFYRRAAIACGLDPDPLFLLVAQEKDAPYLSRAFDFHEADLADANARIDKALRLYADCQETGNWPGYPHTLHTLDLPGFHYTKHEEFMS